MPFHYMPCGACGGAGAATGLTSNNIWIVESSHPSAAYPTSGLSYIPLIAGNSDYIEFAYLTNADGDVDITVVYAMSASSGGDIDLTLLNFGVGVGDDPDAAPGAGSAVPTITPGAGTNVLEVTITVTGAVTGDVGFVRLTRSNADTHTGDMRILGLAA